MTDDIRWARADARHAALSVLPAVVIILAVDVKAGVIAATGLPGVPRSGSHHNAGSACRSGWWGCCLPPASSSGPCSSRCALAVIGIGVLCYLAAKKAAGLIMTASVMPAVAVGMSYDSNSDGLGLARVFALSAIWATLTSLLWPIDNAAARDVVPLLSKAEARRYLTRARGTSLVQGDAGRPRRA